MSSAVTASPKRDAAAVRGLIVGGLRHALDEESGRSAAREVGKTLDFDEPSIDRMAKTMTQFEFVDPEETIASNVRDAGLDTEDPRILQFMRLWREAQDLPRHLGQHSGGMIICQNKLSSFVPLENASMPGRVVAQDVDVVEHEHDPPVGRVGVRGIDRSGHGT